MKDRLLKFMNNEQLSSARFAEIIGVQPSSISHVLSGRNKPGFDFIQKILGKFPSLSAEWLIMGRGMMYRELTDEQKTLQRDLFTDIGSDTDIKEENTSEKVTNVITGDTGLGHKSEFDAENGVTDVKEPRFVEKIVIFYSDSTFSSYSPE